MGGGRVAVPAEVELEDEATGASLRLDDDWCTDIVQFDQDLYRFRSFVYGLKSVEPRTMYRGSHWLQS